MGYLIELLVGAAGSVLAAEVLANAEPASRWLVIRAAARLSDEGERERRREEWLADLNDMPGATAKLLWSFGCHCAVIVANTRAYRRRLLISVASRRQSREAKYPPIGYAPWVPTWLRVVIGGGMLLMLPMLLAWLIAEKVLSAVRRNTSRTNGR